MTSDSLQGNDRSLTIGTAIVCLPGSIRSVLKIDDLTVVLVSNADFEPNIAKEYNRNVFAFDNNGRLIWRIEPLPWGGDVPKSYSNIYKHDEGTLIAYCGVGYEMKVDLGTGRVELWQKPGTPYGQRPW